MKTNTYPSLPEAIELNPAIASVHSYYQDDGFGNLVDTVGFCLKDRSVTYYVYAFLERDTDTTIYYGSH